MSPWSEKMAIHPSEANGATGGAGRTRTGDPLLAKQVLYQLSYDPEVGRPPLQRTLIPKIYFVRSTGTRAPGSQISNLKSHIHLPFDHRRHGRVAVLPSP